MKGAKRTGLRPALQGIPVMPDSEKFRGGEAGSRRIGNGSEGRMGEKVEAAVACFRVAAEILEDVL